MECTELISEVLNNKKDWIDILSALLTPTIALAATIIGVMQWRTNRARLRHEMFDRRYEQFIVVRDFLGSIVMSGNVSEDAKKKYVIGTTGVEFTYSSDVESYLDKNIWQPAIELESTRSLLMSTPIGPERNNLANKSANLLKQLHGEFSKINNVFGAYLKIKE